MNVRPRIFCGKNVTVTVLSKKSGLSCGFCSNVMNGRTRPGIEGLLKIAKALGVTMMEVYEAWEKAANGEARKRRNGKGSRSDNR